MENEKYAIFRMLIVEKIEQLICNNTIFFQKVLCSVLHSYRAIIRCRLICDVYVLRGSDESLRQRIFLKRCEKIEQLICNNTIFFQKALCSVLHFYRAIIRCRLMSGVYAWRESSSDGLPKKMWDKCNTFSENIVVLHIYLSINIHFSLERLVFLYLSVLQTYIGIFTWIFNKEMLE